LELKLSYFQPFSTLICFRDVLKSSDQSSLTMEVPQFTRANPSINQYAFSGCYANDAPNSGHCRPQIDSAQGWSSNVQNAGWMSIDLQGATRVAGILLQVGDSKVRTANLNYGAPKTHLTGPQQQLRLQPVAFQAS